MSHTHLPLEERMRIVTLYTHAKMNKRQIARETHHKPDSVTHWIRQWEDYGNVNDQPHIGATPKVTVKDKAWMRSKAKRLGWDSTKISTELKRQRHVDITPRHVRRILNEQGLRNKAARKKHPLSAAEREKRLLWAKRNINRNWDRVLFTDYAKLELGSRKKRGWVEKDEFLVVEKKAHPPKLNVWLALSAAGPGKLTPFRDNLTTELHMDIIRKGVPPVAKKHFTGNWWLLTDNDPKTKRPKVLELYQSMKIKRLEFPAYSPDGNVAENAIKALKDRVGQRGPRDLEELERYAQEEFKKQPKELCQNLAASMKDRCQAIIDAEGGSTRY